jgi:homoserine dehydrogenase
MNIGLIGCGIVGVGVVSIIKKMSTIKITKICVRDINKQRGLPEGITLTTDPYDIINDNTIGLIIEVMGGVCLAKDVIFDAIKSGKHVVTANKALVSLYLQDIEVLVDKYGVSFGYEATVCGGIPIIHTLQNDYIADDISQISGIVNGTTNFILSTMEANPSTTFKSALKEAQSLGYAEADPSADIEGLDARSKINILARLGIGKYIDDRDIHPIGIGRVTPDDFEQASHLGYTIKMICVVRLSSGDSVEVMVSPMLVHKQHIFSSVKGATNIVEIVSTNLNSTILIGEGAGSLPTANSIVSDILLIVEGKSHTPPFGIKDRSHLVLRDNYESCFYLRLSLRYDKEGIDTLVEVFDNSNIPIVTIRHLPVNDISSYHFVVVTGRTCTEQIKNICDVLVRNNIVYGVPFSLPIF